MDTEIIGIMFSHSDGTVGYWNGFTLSEKEQNAIWKILSKHDTEGCSVRGSLEDVKGEI